MKELTKGGGIFALVPLTTANNTGRETNKSASHLPPLGRWTTMSKLCVPNEILERHIYCIGRARSGKTNLVNHINFQRMWRGDGVAFIEPHGDAAEEMLGRVPPWRIKKKTK
jgi:hypothetical protein